MVMLMSRARGFCKSTASCRSSSNRNTMARAILEEPMEISAIREALHRQPFRPFSLRLADGREISVPNTDFVALSQRRVVVINHQDESTSILEPLLIVSVEYMSDGQ